MPNFRNQKSFQQRQEESSQIAVKYPDRVPVIVEKSPQDHTTNQIDRKKFLVPKELSLHGFIAVLRRRIELDETKAMYLFFNEKTMPAGSMSLGEIAAKHSDADGFLYCIYAGETTFG